MKKFIFVLFLSMLILVAGCSDSYDEEGFAQVDEYSEAIIPAIDFALIDTAAWLEDPSDENLDNMVNSAEEINGINNELYNFYEGEEYDHEEIQSWMLNRSIGEDEWVIDGEDLSNALFNIEDDSEYLAELIFELEESPDQVDVEQFENAFIFAEESMEELRQIMVNSR